MKQRLFLAVEQCLMEQEKPSESLNAFLEQGAFLDYPFHMLQRLQGTEQSPVHHPEGNVWNHTLLVVDQAASRKEESTDPRAFMWAALLHDIGKPDATKIRKGRITAYDHDKMGADLAREFLVAFDPEPAFIDRVFWLVRYHMQPLFVIKNLPYQDIGGMKKHVSIRDIALLGLCDRLGRTDAQEEREEQNLALFLDRCSSYQVKNPLGWKD